MRVLQCHNYYQRSGGEDQVFDDERNLLEHHGHKVIRYTRHNDAIKRSNRVATALRTLWNPQTYRELRRLIRQQRPDVMHCTNTFPLLSPSAYYAAGAEGVPVIQSLHNYRLICPGALLMRDGRVCTDCLNKRFAWPAVRYGCYQGSAVGSAVVSTLLATHHGLGTWSRQVSRYIALTEFARGTFIEAGWPAEKIVVKPNFIHPDPGLGSGDGQFALFAGRLDAAKGISMLLSAWQQVGTRLPLIVAGDGPLAAEVRAAEAVNPAIRYVGSQQVAEVLELMGRATVLVLPSLWFEGFPKTIVEAFSRGLPVVCSRLGSMQRIVDNGRTGLHFTPGCSDELAERVLWLLDRPEQLATMRINARHEYQLHYTANANHEQLISIYQQALAQPSAETTLDA